MKERSLQSSNVLNNRILTDISFRMNVIVKKKDIISSQSFKIYLATQVFLVRMWRNEIRRFKQLLWD